MQRDAAPAPALVSSSGVDLPHCRSRSIFKVSTFPRLNDTRVTLHECPDWPSLVEAIGQHKSAVRKDSPQLFNATEWMPGHGPKKGETKFVIGVWFAIFDFDDLHESDLSKVLGPLRGAGLAHVVMSTFSHTGRRKKPDSSYKDKIGNLIPALAGTYYQLRIVFPFSRMVLPSEWPRIWDVLSRQLFAGLSDTGCKDLAHRYYAPSFQEGTGVAPLYQAVPGLSLDIDTLLAALGPQPRDASPVVVARSRTTLDRHDLGRIARALKASPKKRDLGEALERIVRGEPYAESGGRHPLTVRLVREILDRHPVADRQAVADLFMPSLAQMQPTHLSREVILGFCDWKEPNTPVVDHTTRIAEAFNGARGEAYVQEDILQMAENLGHRADELQRRWVIQKGASYYLLCDGAYRCYGEADVVNAALRDLAPAATVGVDLYEMTQRGSRRKTIGELMESYGSVANEVVVDLTAQRAHYDPITRHFIEAPCPIRVTSRYDPDVERWLTLLAGEERAPKLFDWLASVTKLDEPCAALYLEGPPGTGKSLLAHAVARIFTEGAPTPLKDAMAAFNELITKCPIVFADETVPKDSRGHLQTAEIREFIQARTRTLNRKYRPAATVKGALRLILAANNRGLLETAEHLTEHDISAFSERFLHLPVQPEAREFILAHDTTQWMAEDRVARHVMWLVENWEVKREGRFIVAGESKELVESLSTQTGLRAQICQWVAGYLLRPQIFTAQYSRDKLILSDGTQLFVTARAIHEAWTLYIQDRGTPPTPTAIARALGGLSREAFQRGPDGRTSRMRNFDLSALVMWGQATGYLDMKTVQDALIGIEKATVRRTGTVVN